VNAVSENANTLLEAAMQLSEAERLLLASQIMDTLPAEDVTCSIDDPDLLAELDRRFADPEGALPWSELETEG
jgi:putative addiction module component (TIGR02574 family)